MGSEVSTQRAEHVELPTFTTRQNNSPRGTGRNPSATEADTSALMTEDPKQLLNIAVQRIRELFANRPDSKPATQLLRATGFPRYLLGRVQYTSRQPGILNDFISHTVIGSSKTVFPETRSVMQCFDVLAEDLALHSALHICVVATQTEAFLSALSLHVKLLQIGRLRQFTLALPLSGVIYLLRALRFLSRQEVSDILNSLSDEQPATPLPLRADFLERTGPNSGHQKRWLRFRFTWPEKPDPYDSDLAVYTWQPSCSKPRKEFLQIFLFRSKEDWRQSILVFAKSPRVVRRITELRSACKPHRARMPLAHQCNDLLAAILRLAQEEMTDFVSLVENEIEQMKFIGRKNPSGSKVYHLLHLQDHVKGARQGIKSNIRQVEKLSKQLVLFLPRPRPEEDPRRAKVFNKFVRSQAQTEKTLRVVESKLDDGIAIIKSQMDLVQLRRTLILSILAGLYIPLSFVTSFMGMNLNSIDETTQWWRNVTESTGNSTEVKRDIHVSSNGESQNWTLSLFWTIAGPSQSAPS
ncbi:hypothetical protein B0T10DRAFT_565494 [Thelonectria olida]|uniref:Uncharacterized protein n=1 Tax=Thelonectria olida TaxID=1576542 RepID=A0A9P8VXC9_9HYPO|nr:hypothetical protein B0T10DRAFT_565494 [Thelonectria olida]